MTATLNVPGVKPLSDRLLDGLDCPNRMRALQCERGGGDGGILSHKAGGRDFGAQGRVPVPDRC